MEEPKNDTTRRRPLRRMGLAIGLAGGMILGSAGSAVAIHQFTDVPDSNPFHDDIAWLVDNNIADGFPDNTYKPGSAVTRQSMSAFMRRLAGGDPAVDPMVNAALLEGRTPADFDNAVSLNGRTPADYDNAVSLNGRTPADYDDAVTLNGVTSANIGEQRWAVVESNATLVRGSAGTTASKIGTGTYEVAFNRNVSTCSYVVIPGSTTSDGGGFNGQATVAPRFLNPNGVFIVTQNSSGIAADAPFHLQVMC